tara:strand:- start:2771 stop:3916 length:1146 start_codon:yes stop_codon:yes gene_type:complete
MQLFKSIKKIQLTIVNLLIISGVALGNPIGDIVEHTGAAQITRDSENLIVSDTSLPNIELYDQAETANGRMLIEFLDKAELSLKEHTEVYIDEVYYDPDPSKSKMAMRMVMGTARFASGKLNMVNKNNIDIQTPTATIAVRGTDFTTTIDELGRSLVVLLPDEFGGPSGVITVFNEGGEVILDKAFQATMVSTISSSPTNPVTIQNLTTAMIDNMFIVNPPQEVKQAVEEAARDDSNQDQGILDVDFLEFNELEQDALKDTEGDLEFTELDIDLLDVDFLQDLLDVIEALERTVARLDDQQASTGGPIKLNGAVFGFNKDSQFNIFEQDGDIVFYRNVNGVINIVIGAGGSGFIDTRVDGYEGIISFGSGDGIEIIINQSN